MDEPPCIEDAVMAQVCMVPVVNCEPEAAPAQPGDERPPAREDATEIPGYGWIVTEPEPAVYEESNGIPGLQDESYPEPDRRVT